MAWRYDKPLVSMTSEEQNEAARQLWNNEPLGGITEDNNRLPQAVVWLLVLTIVTAFLVTAPLWGQRPQAAIYDEYVALMDTPEVMAKPTDAEKMAYIVDTVKAKGSKYAHLQERHPLEMDDLRMVKDQIVELQNSGVNLEEYEIVGNKVILANFEGNCRGEGLKSRDCANGRVALQPHWDLGYTIDIFYVLYFCIAVMVTVKRLPGFEWQPTHAGH